MKTSREIIRKIGIILVMAVLLVCTGDHRVYATSPVPVPTPAQPTPAPFPNNGKVTTWNLVDSGKHMDWSSTSKYTTAINEGIGIWNSYKSGVIRKDNIFTVCDVKISDTTTIAGYPDAKAVAYSDGRIVFSTDNMDQLIDQSKTEAVANVIGNALGLADREEDTHRYHIMYYKVNFTITLCRLEKETYDYLYDNVY